MLYEKNDQKKGKYKNNKIQNTHIKSFDFDLILNLKSCLSMSSNCQLTRFSIGKYMTVNYRIFSIFFFNVDFALVENIF